jgi:hypothetical protein
MTGAVVWTLFGHHIGCQPGNLTPDARPLTRKNRDFTLAYVLFTDPFSCGTGRIGSFHFNVKIVV